MQLTVYNILNAAADLIEKDGRCTGYLTDGQKHCPLGAISRVVTDYTYRPDGYLPYPREIEDNKLAEAGEAAQHALFATIAPIGVESVPTWNDARRFPTSEPLRSDAEIIETMREAAIQAWVPQDGDLVQFKDMWTQKPHVVHGDVVTVGDSRYVIVSPNDLHNPWVAAVSALEPYVAAPEPEPEPFQRLDHWVAFYSSSDSDAFYALGTWVKKPNITVRDDRYGNTRRITHWLHIDGATGATTWEVVA